MPAGYRLADKSVSPTALRIAGSETRVGAVAKVETDAIDVSHLRESGEFRVNAFAADPQVRLESSPAVTVKLSIEQTNEGLGK